MQVQHMHSKGLVYKYLNPLNIVVTEGFLQMDPYVRVHITDIAIMQLLDVPEPIDVLKSISGTNQLFVAPEIILSNN